MLGVDCIWTCMTVGPGTSLSGAQGEPLREALRLHTLEIHVSQSSRAQWLLTDRERSCGHAPFV
jgi:hypothetical protein